MGWKKNSYLPHIVVIFLPSFLIFKTIYLGKCLVMGIFSSSKQLVMQNWLSPHHHSTSSASLAIRMQFPTTDLNLLFGEIKNNELIKIFSFNLLWRLKVLMLYNVIKKIRFLECWTQIQNWKCVPIDLFQFANFHFNLT